MTPLRYMIIGLAAALLAIGSCLSRERRVTPDRPKSTYAIVVGGERFAIDAKVVLWNERGGFNGYLRHRSTDTRRVLPANPAPGCNTPERYGVRACFLDEDGEALESQGDGLERLRAAVNQIVLHYDAAGTSARCFRVLHDERGLSAHFLVDVDGTIYQTLDVRERARHAGESNDRSVGIEIANVGAYDEPEKLQAVFDAVFGTEGAVGVDGAVGAGEMVTGRVQRRHVYQFPFSDRQYEALAALTASLRAALPRIEIAAPRDSRGAIIASKLRGAAFSRFSGVLGHYHVASHKVDPGPAFEWERFLRMAKAAERRGAENRR